MSRRSGALVAIGVAGVVGVGAAVGISTGTAATPGTALQRITTVSSVSSAHDARQMPVVRLGTTRTALLKARQAKVVKAVLAKYRHATVLKLVPRREDAWLVTLRLADHRVGTVVVDRHLKVGPFRRLPTTVVHPIPVPRPMAAYHPPAPAATNPTQTGTIGGDSAISGPHW
ncbi:MAG TPA: hypothetical protein VI248_00405 [Kineosporiaceae bacterium]